MKTMMSSFHFLPAAAEIKRKGMPLPNKILLFLLTCLLSLAGCLLTSKEPVGETPASINPQDWEGTWVSNSSMGGTRVL